MKTNIQNILAIEIESKLESKRDYRWDYLCSVEFHSPPRAEKFRKRSY